MPTPELMGIPTAEIPMQGRSLQPLLAGQSLDLLSFSHARAVSEEEDSVHSVRSDRWRLVWDRATGAARLYDLTEDPGETRDVAPANPGVVALLRGALEEQDERNRAVAGQIRPADPFAP
jgi:arylsulfatase A-like enzyme